MKLINGITMDFLGLSFSQEVVLPKERSVSQRRVCAGEKSKNGFTLVDFLVVVALIGIFAAITIPQFINYEAKGYMATIRSDTKNVHAAVVTYKADHHEEAVPDETIKGGDTGATGKIYNLARVLPGNEVEVKSGSVTGKRSNAAVVSGNYVINSDGIVTDNLKIP